MSSVQAIVASVDYGDFLKLTLPRLAVAVDKVVVATSPTDLETQSVCREHRVACVVTDCWTRDGASFAKAYGLDSARACLDEPDWLLAIDADILLPEGVRLQSIALDQTCLYGARRFDCVSREDWDTCDGDFSQFPRVDAPRRAGRPTRGSEKTPFGRSTSNDAALSGYFQLWHWPTHSISFERDRRYMSASDYDIDFALRFGEQRRWLEGFSCLHLGERKKNWQGRVTGRWSCE